MVDVSTVLVGNRVAVDDLIAAAGRTGAAWTTPRAPGKWSPSQVVEHVARALEESANVVAGTPSKFPTFPTMLRPIVRGLFFNRVLRKGRFPKAKTTKALDPATGPATPAEARRRLEGALAQFDQACRTRAASGPIITSTLFGAVSVEDYAKFQELHTRHHRAQLPG
jgi:hypothetical protein